MAGRVFNYGRPRATANRLVARFGTVAELRQAGAAYPTHVVLSDYRSSQVDGTLIKRGDFVGLVAASDVAVVPSEGAVLFWEGRERTIMRVTQTKPGPTAVLYELQLRGVR